MSKERYLITSALPYANGPLHIGHIAGAYLPADIYTRFQKLKGRDAIHICGTDEHGVAIIIAAMKEGKTPKELVDYYYENIKESFKKLGIIFDNFSRTTKPIHYKLSQDFFLKLYEKGYIVKKDVVQFYCKKDAIFLPDRYIVGTCPHCGYENARGDQCEKCGRWLEPTDLISPRCALCGMEPELRESFQYFFLLDKLEEKLRSWLESKVGVWKDNVVKFALGWLREGLKPRAITRDLEWGVPVPLEEAKGKVLYVWFDAPIGYISSTIEWNEELWESYWKDENTKLIHFIGKDNIVFHAIVWPAMLMAYGDFVLPHNIPANEFLNLMGQKISTSRGWALWIDELVERFHPDYIRFFIAYILPENKDADFNLYEFQSRVNNELINKYGNLVSRVLGFVARFKQGKIPEVSDVLEEYLKDFEKLADYIEQVEKHIEGFEFRKALYTIISALDYINAYIDRKQPWKNPEDQLVFTIVQMLRSITIAFEPFIPFSAEKVLSSLSVGSYTWDDAKRMDYKLSGKPVSKLKLYRKIEDKDIEETLKLFKERSASDDYVEYEQFAKIDLRIGKVVKARRIERSNKLLLLEVDLGNEVRQIVAGIGKVYEPEELIGKSIVIVANLKPKKIMGYESQGMLLAAGETPVLIVPEKDVEPGTKVS